MTRTARGPRTRAGPSAWQTVEVQCSFFSWRLVPTKQEYGDCECPYMDEKTADSIYGKMFDGLIQTNGLSRQFHFAGLFHQASCSVVVQNCAVGQD